MIVYYLYLKLKLVFSPRNNIWGFAALLLLIPAAVLYGRGIAKLMDGSIPELTETMRRTFETGLPVFIAAITFLRGFFPSYKPIRSPFRSFYPIRPAVRFILNILGDLISVYFIVMGCFIGTFLFFSLTTGIEYSIYLLFALTGSHLLRRLFQTVFENKIKPDRQTSILLFVCLISLLLAAGLWPFFESFTLWFMIGCFGLLLFMDFILEELCPKEKGVLKSAGKTNHSFTIDLLWQNKIARTTLVAAMILKVFVLITDSILYFQTGNHITNNISVVFLFISPLVLFTYLFNNCWGYFRNVWLLADRALSTGREMFHMYLRLLWFPLSVDFLITMIWILLFPSDLVLPGISMYVGSLFILTVGGFFWSFQIPSHVEKAFAFKANTSVFGSFVSIGVVFGFLTVFISDWFYLMVPVYTGVSLIILKGILNAYPAKREKIFLKLYKS